MHNVIAVLLVAAATSYRPFVSPTSINPALRQRQNAIASELSPSAQQKLQNIATSLRMSSSITDGASRSAAGAAFQGFSLSDADIEALAFIVMMEAAQSADEDLKSIMAAVDAMNKQKESLRHELNTVHQATTTVPHAHKFMRASATTAFIVPPPLSPNATTAEKQKRLDDLGDLSDMAQLRIQNLMDQRQLATTLASSMVRKTDTANKSVLQKLK